MYRRMHYVQRFHDARKFSPMSGMHRLITPECDNVGFGVTQQIETCYQWLRNQDLAIYPVRFEKLNVTLYVIGTQESLERFNAHIGKHFCSEPLSRASVSSPGLYERFVSKNEERAKPFSKTNVWMETTAGLAPEYADTVAPPMIFTADRFMAIRMYLELQKHVLNPNKVEPNIFDKALCYRSRLEQTVIALNEDDTISLRSSEHTMRLHKNDVWVRDLFPLQKLQEFGVL